MSAEDTQFHVENPELVHWSPRHGMAVGDGPGVGLYVLALVGVVAVGAVAIGAVAVGALAIGQLTIGRGKMRELRIGRLEVGDLLVKRSVRRPF